MEAARSFSDAEPSSSLWRVRVKVRVRNRERVRVGVNTLVKHCNSKGSVRSY